MELEHLWTPAFWRWISSSSDEKRLKVLQKVILHKLGNTSELKDNSKKIEGALESSDLQNKKVTVKLVFPKGTLKNFNVETLKRDFSTLICNNIQNVVQIKPVNQFRINKDVLNVNQVCENNKIVPLETATSVVDPDISEAVYKLVMEKFGHVLKHYHKRSVLRSSTRKKFSCDDNLDDVDSQNERSLLSATNIPKNEESFLNAENELEIATGSIKTTKINNENTQIGLENEIISNISETNSKTDLENLFEDNWSAGCFECNCRTLSKASLEDNINNHFNKNVKCKKFNFPMLRAVPSTRSLGDTRSVDTSDVSTLLTRSLQRATPTSIQTCEQPRTFSHVNEALQRESKQAQLVQECERQYQTMAQASKVLDIYSRCKDFKSKPEYLEVEKILLLATNKFEAVQKTRRKMEYEKEDVLTNVGQVRISNLAFIQAQKNQHVHKFTRWFVAILSCDATVLATEVVQADSSGIVRFPNILQFQKLNITFGITVDIYSIKVKKSKNSNNKMDTTTCSNSYNFLNFNKSPRILPKKNFVYNLHESSFALCGTTTINRIDLSENSILKLTNVPNNPNLRGTITMNLTSSIEFPDHAAFLTIGTEVNGTFVWNRRWVFLDKYILKLSNYPTDSPPIEPLSNIDLSLCSSSSISQVDRTLCARPHTLLLETSCQSDDTKSSRQITRHYLSADNVNDMEAWEQLLNCVLCALRTWNCMRYR